MRKWVRTLSGALCAALLVSSVPALARTTTANKNITVADAKDVAWEQVPNNCSFLTVDAERYWHEIKYFDVTTQQKHAVEVGKTTGSVLERSMKAALPAGKSVKISPEAAKQVVTTRYKAASGITAKLNQDDSGSWYDVDFHSSITRGNAKINAETGDIMSWRETFIGEKDQELLGVVKSTPIANDALKVTSVVSRDSIIQAVNQQVSGGTIEKILLTGNNTIYDVKIHKGDYEYDMLLNALTGNRISMSSQYDPADLGHEWYQKPGTVKKQPGQIGSEQIRTPSTELTTDQYIGKKLAGSNATSATITGTAKNPSKAETKTTGLGAVNTDYITRDRAKRIAFSMAPGGSLLKSMSLKSSGGKTYYQGWLKKDGIRYAFQIDANTAEVIGSGTEVDPDWDPKEHHDYDSLKDEDKDYDLKWLD